MDTLEFSSYINPESLASIFKDYFEQHIAAYYMLRGLDFVSLNASGVDAASIMYSIKLLKPEDANRIVEALNRDSSNIVIYGIKIKPNIFISGDLLCITLKKE